MGITSDYFFLDRCNDTNGTHLRVHSPDSPMGALWSLPHNGRLEIQNSRIEVASGFSNGRYSVTTGDSAPDPTYCEQNYLVTVLSDTIDSVFVGDVGTLIGTASTGWTLRWRPRAGPGQNFGEITLQGHGVSVTAQIPLITAGTHLIRIVGEDSVLTGYVAGFGVRITDISSFKVYDQLGISISTNHAVDLVYGKAGIEPDFVLFFDLDLGGGGPAGASGGGGGSGGSPSGGGSNPSDIPCDPNTTLVINNGEVVSVAPTNPCQWTGLIWWKFVCEDILTVPEYAVEVEVFFNTLTDSFMSVGPIARLIETTGGHYWLTLWNDGIVLGKKPSEAQDDIVLAFKALTLIPGTWYKLRLEVEGFTLRGYLDDALQITAVDLNESFPAAGCAGVRLSRGNPATDIRFDNFRVWLNVRRPSFAEIPVFLESISVLKDDGMTSDFNIGIADSFAVSELLTLLTPKTVHINEGIIFTDLARQVKKVSDALTAGDTLNPVEVLIALNDMLQGNETLNPRMNIPVTEVATFTDTERAIHGISETMTVGEFLIAVAKQSGALDLARASDTVKVTRTSTATFVKPEQTYEARALKTILFVDDGKRVG